MTPSTTCQRPRSARAYLATLTLLAMLSACVEPPETISTPTEELDATADLQDLSTTPVEDMPDMAPDLSRDAAQDMPVPEDMGMADMRDMADMAPVDMAPAFECGQEPAQKEPEGNGTLEDPFVVCHQEHFQKMEMSEAHFVLGKNILLDSTWSPLSAFRGTLDGQGFSIEGASLTLRHVKNPSPCENFAQDGALNRVMGSFIHTLNGATIRNVTFLRPIVGGGANEDRIPTKLVDDASGNTCYLTTGGVFGQIRQHDTRRSTLQHINILGLTAKVGGRFGGLANRVRDANLSNIYIGPLTQSSLDTQIFLTDTQSGGFVSDLGDSTLRDVHVDIKMYIESATPHLYNREGRAEYSSHGLFVGLLDNAVIDGLIVQGSITNTQNVPDGSIIGHLGGLVGGLNVAEATSNVSISNCLVDVHMFSTGVQHAGVLAGTGRFKQGRLKVEDCKLKSQAIGGTQRGAGFFGDLNFIMDSYTSTITIADAYLMARLEGIGRNGCIYANSNQTHAETQQKFTSFTFDDSAFSFSEPVMDPITCDYDAILKEAHMGSLQDTWSSYNEELYPSRVVEMLTQRQ